MLEILQAPFIQNAFLASSLVAIIAAIIGYFLIIRGLTFAGHALSHVGFAGAAGSVMLGIDPIFGLLAFTIGGAAGIGALGEKFRERDIAIGVITTFALGLGMLFLYLYKGYAERAYSILFGTILGISQTDVLVTALFSAITLALLLTIFRPLLFSSFDPEVAQARGVPVRLIALLFLVLVAITIALSVQVVGVLLVFTLLVGPAATATRLVSDPFKAIMLAIGLGLSYTWVGIFLAAQPPFWPASFFIAALSFGVYLPVRLLAPQWRKRRLASAVQGRDLVSASTEEPDLLTEKREPAIHVSGRRRG